MSSIQDKCFLFSSLHFLIAQMSQTVPLVPILQDWNLANLTLDSWAGGGGSGDSLPETLGAHFPIAGLRGRKTGQKQGQEGVGSPSGVLPLPGNSFAILTPPLPVPGSSSGPIRNRMWVGGDFPMVGAPAPSPDRYKATSPDRGI